jgi:hypothetical protein
MWLPTLSYSSMKYHFSLQLITVSTQYIAFHTFFSACVAIHTAGCSRSSSVLLPTGPSIVSSPPEYFSLHFLHTSPSLLSVDSVLNPLREKKLVTLPKSHQLTTTQLSPKTGISDWFQHSSMREKCNRVPPHSVKVSSSIPIQLLHLR